MRFKREPIRIEEAKTRIAAHIRTGAAQEVALEDSFGRYLAEDVPAKQDMPHFRRSGMDGFAVRAEDVAGATPERPVKLTVVETIPCGAVPAKTIARGQAARIMTGAAVPDGADAVVMFEMTESGEKDGITHVAVQHSVAAGDNVTPVGFEVKAGTPILERGRRVNAGEAALLAAFGYATVRVFRQPTVAIFATGSELLGAGEPLQPGKIRNSNSYMLAEQVKNAGGRLVRMETLPDDVEKAKEAVLAAFAEADLIITTGGVSVGDYDILVDIFAQWDGEMLFNKLAMRPGSPTTVGIRKGQFLFALSGNPGACFVGFELLVRPVIWGMQGKRDIDLPQFTAKLAEDFPKKGTYQRFVRAYSYVRDGHMYVKPVGIDKSSITLSIKDANCLFIAPEGDKSLRKGETVSALSLNVLE